MNNAIDNRFLEFDESPLDRYRHRMSPVIGAQLRQNMRHVVLGGFLGDRKPIGADSDGLTEAENEAGLVAAALGVPPLVGAIDPATLPQLVSSARRIHIAAHNFFNARDLFASSLRLGAGRSIQAWELFRLIRSPELVMLSGCETLSEAVTFLDSFSTGAAGAKWVVGTRWKLHDRAASTAAAAFYSALGSNAPPRALWLAKNHLIEDGYAHPYYWAAFEMMAPNLASVF